jgi:hypothetical protein
MIQLLDMSKKVRLLLDSDTSIVLDTIFAFCWHQGLFAIGTFDKHNIRHHGWNDHRSNGPDRTCCCIVQMVAFEPDYLVGKVPGVVVDPKVEYDSNNFPRHNRE